MVIPRWSRAGMSYLRYFDAEMGDALTESLQEFAGNPNIHFVIVTGGTPGYFNRHFSIPALIEFVEAVRASGREWPDNAAYYGGFFDKAMALCETTPKPVIAAISGTALAGAFEFTLACDIRIAEDGDYLIGLPETELGLLPGASGTQRLHRTIGPAATLIHIVMGRPPNPRDAEKKGLVHETAAATPSIGRWRSQNGSARIRRNRSAISSASSALQSTRLSLKAWHLSGISS